MKGSKKQSKNYLIILLVVLLLALAVGYAAFTDVLNISGTASANGNFDLEFQNAVVDKKVGCTDATATISTDKNTLTVDVAELAYPGAGAQFTVDIVNVGNIPAKVNSVTPTNITGSDNIKISGLDVINTSHPVIEADGTCTLTFTVEWDKDSTEALTAEEKAGISFGLEIEYTQATTEVFEGEASHADA